jgi:hypothetical protein
MLKQLIHLQDVIVQLQRADEIKDEMKAEDAIKKIAVPIPSTYQMNQNETDSDADVIEYDIPDDGIISNLFYGARFKRSAHYVDCKVTRYYFNSRTHVRVLDVLVPRF